MNLQEQWQHIESADEDLSYLIKRGVRSISSKDPLEKIRRGLVKNAAWGLLLSIGYILLLIKFPAWQVLLCLGIVLAFTLWITVKALALYREMGRPSPHNNLLQEMERHYTGIMQWMAVQQRAGWFIYPISAAGGFMLGGSLGAGKSIDEVMNKPWMLVAMLITLAIMVPVCHYLAKWMFRKAFGKYADQLKANIDKLRSEE